MSEPSDDLFGPVPASEPPAGVPDTGDSDRRRKAAKPKAAAGPTPRFVAPTPPTMPTVYEPIPMGRGGRPAAEDTPAPPPLPRLKRRRLAIRETCNCCGRPSSCDEEVVIERDFHPEEVVRACEPCRSSTGADFPRAGELSGAVAGPWCVALLREAGRLAYEKRRGTL